MMPYFENLSYRTSSVIGNKNMIMILLIIANEKYCFFEEPIANILHDPLDKPLASSWNLQNNISMISYPKRRIG